MDTDNQSSFVPSGHPNAVLETPGYLRTKKPSIFGMGDLLKVDGTFGKIRLTKDKTFSFVAADNSLTANIAGNDITSIDINNIQAAGIYIITKNDGSNIFFQFSAKKIPILSLRRANPAGLVKTIYYSDE